MTPIQAQQALKRGHEACNHMVDMFYSRGYSPHEYDQTSDALCEVLDDLYANREFGHLSNLMRHVTRILTPSPQQGSRRPGITTETLIKHLLRFPIEPEIAETFIFGDADLSNLVVRAALKSDALGRGSDESWQVMLTNLAKDGDVENWKLLSEGIFFGSCLSAQRCDALTSIGSFETQVVLQSKEVLGAHIQHLLDNNQQPIKFESMRYEPTFDVAAKLYDTLKVIGHLPLAHEFIERDKSECHSQQRMQDYQFEYQWTPSESAVRWLSRTRFGVGRDRLATSITVHLLTLPELPEDVQFNEFPLQKLAEILEMDGKTYKFGTLNFTPSVVGQLVDRCVNAYRSADPFQALVSAGVSPTHAQMSPFVREARFGTDLGL